MKKKYIVTLTEAERQMLQAMLSQGKAAARKLMHARILLKADASPGGPGWNDEQIAEGLEVGRATVERVRKEFVEEGLEAALERRKPRRQYRAEVGWRRRSALGGLGMQPGRPKVAAVGRCGCWRTAWCSWSTWSRCRIRPVRRTLKKTNLSLG